MMHNADMFANANALFNRPGEPYRKPLSTHHQQQSLHQPSAPPAPPAPPAPLGVEIQRYTTKDFKTWSDSVTVGWLPNGSGDKHDDERSKFGFEPLDGAVWTPKSIDRNPVTGVYLMFASYGSAAHTFTAVKPETTDAFKPTTGTLKNANFHDHDDCNVYYQAATDEWVDFQIMYELYDAVGLDPAKIKKYCDNVSNNTRRVITVRTSKDGANWTQDAGCADEHQKDEHCSTFNTKQLMGPVVLKGHTGSTAQISSQALVRALPTPHEGDWERSTSSKPCLETAPF